MGTLTAVKHVQHSAYGHPTEEQHRCQLAYPYRLPGHQQQNQKHSHTESRKPGCLCPAGYGIRALKAGLAAAKLYETESCEHPADNVSRRREGGKIAYKTTAEEGTHKRGDKRNL